MYFQKYNSKNYVQEILRESPKIQFLMDRFSWLVYQKRQPLYAASKIDV